MRIGIVGTENSHVDHVIDHLNTERGHDGARVVAVSGGPSERNEALRAKGDLERIVDEPGDLLDLVDAVVVADRHGGLHRAHALPFLEAGLPVFVDKPLACTVSDAEALVAAARANNAALTSYSALRWLPDTDALAAVAGPDLVTASGPADPASPHGGVFFYGIHPVDVALRLARGAVGEVEVTRLTDGVIARAAVGDATVRIELAFPRDGVDPPFRGSVRADGRTTERALTLDRHYFVPGLELFLAMVETGRPPVEYDDLLRPVRLLHAIAEAVD
ncbi:Gfo/Idh/MocA family oxidoreductase [Umezawaea endophytica]|uniref:Gfo/Idh/MocA family oxidoreductase n=1 Tax=Umezawaea endophytica TaxID=1654476 RepID=A0A9X2VJF0_9PSEU|nr:Gfo/Idh/MocA family oxidoreductase [Umezawaea endophytica]MCS7477708.1 Gfo/Idh/MocA family oxidoreductase [Umezawaea endophytica]